MEVKVDTEIVLLVHIFFALPDGSLDKTEVIFFYSRCVLSLKDHLQAKHTVDAESPARPRQRQTTLDSLQ